MATFKKSICHTFTKHQLAQHVSDKRKYFTLKTIIIIIGFVGEMLDITYLWVWSSQLVLTGGHFWKIIENQGICDFSQSKTNIGISLFNHTQREKNIFWICSLNTWNIDSFQLSELILVLLLNLPYIRWLVNMLNMNKFMY